VNRVRRGTPSGDAYLDLQNEARRAGRSTQELLQLYVLEGFLARLAASDVRESFVLTGGVLLAAFGSRRPTKDVDLAGIDVANDTATVLEMVRAVLVVEPPVKDGIKFVAETATTEIIREEDDYSGVRVHVEAHLAKAKLPFHIDVNLGDPIWPAPATVSLPRLRGGEPIELQVIRCTWSTPRRSSPQSSAARRTPGGVTSGTSGPCRASIRSTPTT